MSPVHQSHQALSSDCGAASSFGSAAASPGFASAPSLGSAASPGFASTSSFTLAATEALDWVEGSGCAGGLVLTGCAPAESSGTSTNSSFACASVREPLPSTMASATDRAYS